MNLVKRCTTSLVLGGLLAACSSSNPKPSPNGQPGNGQPGNDGGIGDGSSNLDSSVGTPDGGTTTCADYAADYCTFLNACQPGSLQGTYGTVASCESIVAAECVTSSSAPNTGFTPTFLDACSNSYAKRGALCVDAGPQPELVTSASSPCIISGEEDGGEACGVDSQCGTNDCQRPGTLCGLCTSQGALGEGCDYATGVTCAPGLACSSTNYTCITVVGPNGTCDLDLTTSCVAGTRCVVTDAGATGGLCVPEGVAVGTPCNTSNVGVADCWANAGMYCDNTNHCAAILYGDAGATCQSANADAGQGDCAFGSCVDGSCASDIPEGQACVENGGANCAAQTVCVMTGATGTCTPDTTSCSSTTPLNLFAYQPSNISLTAIAAATSTAQDENVSASTSCTITTGSTAPNAGCLASPISVVTEPGGTSLNLIVTRSFTLQVGATLTVTGGLPLVIVSLSDAHIYGQIQANAATTTAGPGGAGGAGADNAPGAGPGAGYAGSGTVILGGGGASFCGTGGPGGGADGGTPTTYGSPDNRPLHGGSSGGGGTTGNGGAGGGGIQIVAAGYLHLEPAGSITVGGGGGAFAGSASADQNASGGGSGGAILLEGDTVTIDGTLAANGGGGGGGGNNGGDGTDNATPSPGGQADAGGAGGNGGAAGSPNGSAGGAGSASITAGGGGGGAGRIRINTTSGSFNMPKKATVSPTLTDGGCANGGMVRAIGSGQ